MKHTIATVLIALVLHQSPVQASPGPLTPNRSRVEEIAASLPATPRGLGPAITDRAAWESFANNDPIFRQETITRAERYLNAPIPAVTRQAYEASASSGNRAIDKATDHRRFRLTTFVVAEGMERRGRFLEAIDKEIQAICDEHTWISSGHVNFTHGRNDLGTAMTAWTLTAAATLLDGLLPEKTTGTIKQRIHERVLSHYLAAIRNEIEPEWWSIDPNNWNAVVHGGIVASALAFMEKPSERAEIIAAAEIATRTYIQSFPTDGYAPEGMGYWKYGFGHYILLAETVLAATNGKVNFYNQDNMALIARFPRRFEMSPGVYPAYGDALFLVPPARWLHRIIDGRLGLDPTDANDSPGTTPDPMYQAFLYSYGANIAFDPSAPPVIDTTKNTTNDSDSHGHHRRDWFGQSQVYVGRPQQSDADGFYVSFKGGNNGVSHSHTDLGTFVVERGGRPVLVDPGVTIYNASTLGPRRYQNDVINSYGHSVPLVAGQRQKSGSAHASSVIEHHFSDTTDIVTIDLTRAYAVPALRTLTRRFEYDRTARGSLSIVDRVEFDSPQSFGTALVTYSNAQEQKPGVWIFGEQKQALRATISVRNEDEAAQGNNVSFTTSNEELRYTSLVGKVRRLGINFDAPVTKASITIHIAPADESENR